MHGSNKQYRSFVNLTALIMSIVGKTYQVWKAFVANMDNIFTIGHSLWKHLPAD